MPLLKSLLAVYLLLLVSVYFLQRKMIYQPTADRPHEFETIVINNSKPTIQALITHPNKNQAIIYLGGNAESVIYSAADFEHNLPEFSTYLLKYRGYSGAIGTPTEENLYADVLVLYDHVIQKHHEVTVIGRSLGSGVATFLATERNVNKLILVTPFDSIQNVASDLLPFLPVKWLIKDKFDSKSRAQRINSPTLVVVADQDRVISRKRTNALIENIPTQLLTVITLRAGHNDLDLSPDYTSQIREFIQN